MSDDTIQDLKQFITATISQQSAGLLAEVRSDIKNLDDNLSAKIDALSNSVAEAIETTNESSDNHLQDHERRISLLEQNTG